MDLAALATPQDYQKLAYLRRAFKDLVHSLDTMDFPKKARKEARPILVAASMADIYDGEFEGIVRQYYAFTGDFDKVWFTLDALTVMPLDNHTSANKRRAQELVMQLAASLIREVRPSLREELKI